VDTHARGPSDGEPRDSEPVRVAAHAKVNLRLRVLETSESGYHSIETLFLRLALRDEVELCVGRPGIRLEVEEEPGPLAGVVLRGEPVPRGEPNLCWRAAEAYHRALGTEPALEILLRKRLPAGAGLGGGSADAAAVLRGLEALHDGALGAKRLTELAGELGSDVPFALADTPMALGWERGRRLLPLPAPPSRPVLVLVPDFSVGTPEAYRWLDAVRAGRGLEGAAGGAPGPAEGAGVDAGDGGPGGAYLLPSPERLADWEELEGIAVNDFEGPVFSRHPILAAWKDELFEAGARLALLSGSGSALFAVFGREAERAAAAERFEGREGVAVLHTVAPA
jgi:4-diphosphocytidyl-2-C-methyl-D-erythritol kinase